MKFSFLCRVLMLSLCFCVVTVQPVMGNELSQIKQKIRKQQDKIYQQRKQRNALQAKLKKQELKMNVVIKQLQKTQDALEQIRHSIKKTEKQIVQLQKQEKVQKELLREQLDSAYRSGIHPSVIEKLFSKDAKEADRMSKYYQHMNQARIDLIQDIRKTQNKLTQQQELLEAQQKTKLTQLSAQQVQKKELQQVTSQRAKTISSINKMIEKDKTQLVRLKRNAKALQDKIAKARRDARNQENQELAKLEAKKEQQGKGKLTQAEIQQVRAGNGLGSARKQYAKPVRGRIIQYFNPEQSWKGVVISAATGKNVKAIAAGRVILSDWLQGYGNVVFIDHGKDFTSIYGYNSMVLVQKGDRVKAGEVIAKVGSSGGQNQSGLYFGITYKGLAKNPLRWVK
ncbi:murein hydrolase activator EnvC [Pasteurella skyensis]|nr:murein hydrolase activator EnvC [Pasteurella skyensis]MDP8162469.1 murein hydrolase activator EnvC [Pasteurella skyensis]MDP8177459.1 murein hydrolase activator EnvC [Pasteurella skyensis]MDP8178689.1 murein hydrolase activator EnvC [Pasteurella skyensis]MDP8183021.1 murein hydrolase activator EnvC [Pasteurella skyensis]MDP8189187.1 murein hydrolase activator EnvC [Pasteurella skyensis]